MNRFFCFLLLVVVAFFTKDVVAESAKYKLEVGGVDIGSLDWSIKIINNKYEIKMGLKDEGLFSGLYDFDGEYFAKGSFFDDVFYKLVMLIHNF